MTHSIFEESGKNYDSIDSFYSYIDVGDLVGEQALWQSVIVQAVMDIASDPAKMSDRIERRKTISWFSQHNEDFLLVCSFTDLDPAVIIRGVKNILKQNQYPKKRLLKRNRKHFASARKNDSPYTSKSMQKINKCN